MWQRPSGATTCNVDLFVFRGRRSDLIKIVWHDGQGGCLFMKRLDRRFTLAVGERWGDRDHAGAARLPDGGHRLEEPTADVAPEPGGIAKRLAAVGGCDLIGG